MKEDENDEEKSRMDRLAEAFVTDAHDSVTRTLGKARPLFSDAMFAELVNSAAFTALVIYRGEVDHRSLAEAVRRKIIEQYT